MTTLGLNAAFSLGSNLLGVRFDPHMAFNFLVEIEGLLVGGFSEVTGLQVETEVTTYREGGQNDYVHKLRGPTNYPSNLILKHGLVDLGTLWGWHQEVLQGTFKRRNGTIYLLDNRSLPVMWWNFDGAYPVKWSGPEFHATNNAVAMETVELAHNGLARPETSIALGAASSILSTALSTFG